MLTNRVDEAVRQFGRLLVKLRLRGAVKKSICSQKLGIAFCLLVAQKAVNFWNDVQLASYFSLLNVLADCISDRRLLRVQYCTEAITLLCSLVHFLALSFFIISINEVRIFSMDRQPLLRTDYFPVLEPMLASDVADIGSFICLLY